MNKKVLLFYTVFSVLFFIALAVLIVLRVNWVRTENIDASQVSFNALKGVSRAALSEDPPAFDDDFRSSMQNAFRADERLQVFSIFSYKNGVEYLRARRSALINETAGAEDAIIKPPVFDYKPLYQYKPRGTVQPAGSDSYRIEAVYQILLRRDIFPLVRDSLIIIGVFIVITGFLMIILHYSGKKERSVFPERHYDPFFDDEQPPARQERPAVPDSSEQRPAPAPRTETAYSRGEAPSAREKETLGLFSRDTGLSYREYLEQRLTLELDRAAYNEQDLCFACLRFEGLKRTSMDYRRCASILLEYFPFPDLAFEYSGDSFCIILTNCDLDQSIGQMEEFLDKLVNRKEQHCPRTLIGISSRNGRLVEAGRLIIEAKNALNRSNSASPITGFRSDPAKYRKYIAEQQKKS